MTREEKQKAIDALKISAPVMVVTQEEFNDYIQTLNQVMDWLEQKPCKNAIDRAEAIRVASGYCHFSNIAKELAKLPPVTPEPKMGHWCGYDKDDITQRNWWDINTCSICGNGGKHYNKFRYCPNCGSYNGGAENDT